MQDPPKTVLITVAFFVLNAVFWFAYTLIILFFGDQLSHVPLVIQWLMLLMALGCSIVLAGLAILLKRRNRLAFYAGVLLLTVIAVFSITDEFGLPDLFSLLISLIPLVLILKDRTWYLHQSES